MLSLSRHQVSTCLMLMVAILGPCPVFAQGDPDAGRELAAQWCSRCHDIGPNGAMKQQPPSFAAIAIYRSRDYIRANIIFPHNNMPEIAQLLGLDADDLAAYIVSLEKPCQ